MSRHVRIDVPMGRASLQAPMVPPLLLLLVLLRPCSRGCFLVVSPGARSGTGTDIQYADV